MKKLFLFILKLTLLISLSQADTLDECINTYEIGNLENAEILCIKALEENPKSFETNFTLSLIYHTIGNNEKALEFAKKMEELSISFDDYISSYNQIGTIYGYL